MILTKCRLFLFLSKRKQVKISDRTSHDKGTQSRRMRLKIWKYKDFSSCEAILASIMPIIFLNKAFPLPPPPPLHLLPLRENGGCPDLLIQENNAWWVGQMAGAQEKIWQPCFSRRVQKRASQAQARLSLQTIEERSKVISYPSHQGDSCQNT